MKGEEVWNSGLALFHILDLTSPGRSHEFVRIIPLSLPLLTTYSLSLQHSSLVLFEDMETGGLQTSESLLLTSQPWVTQWLWTDLNALPMASL